MTATARLHAMLRQDLAQIESEELMVFSDCIQTFGGEVVTWVRFAGGEYEAYVIHTAHELQLVVPVMRVDIVANSTAVYVVVSERYWRPDALRRLLRSTDHTAGD